MPPTSSPAIPRDASTVVLLRDAPNGIEVFMVRRHRDSGFMGDAFVFPGGKLDESDWEERVLERARGRTVEQAMIALGEPNLAARALGLFVAAIRETFEEAGVFLGSGSPDRIALARRDLLEKKPFADAIAEHDLVLGIDQLVPWTRWVTPVVEPRRYDARFFLAISPAGQEPEHDQLETTEARWIAPAEALELSRIGGMTLPPPTTRSLEILSHHSSVAAILSEAGSRIPPLVEPMLVQEGSTLALVLPGHPDHPVQEQRLEGPTRFILENGRWWSR